MARGQGVTHGKGRGQGRWFRYMRCILVRAMRVESALCMLEHIWVSLAWLQVTSVDVSISSLGTGVITLVIATPLLVQA